MSRHGTQITVNLGSRASQALDHLAVPAGSKSDAVNAALRLADNLQLFADERGGFNVIDADGNQTGVVIL